MSKLLENIKAVQTNRKLASLGNVTNVSVSEANYPGQLASTYTEYVMQVTIGASFALPDEALYSDKLEIKEIAISRVREQIAHSVFGEYREPLLNLRSAAMKRGDWDTANDISTILKSMFNS